MGNLSLIILVFILLTALSLPTAMQPSFMQAHATESARHALRAPVQTVADLEGIVRQTTDKTCGPATLATLLIYYFGEEVTESDLYSSALQAMLGDGYEDMLWPSITFRGLIGALASKGYTGYPVETTLADLNAYFARYQIPIILRIHHPTPHFTLLIGRVGDLYVLADSMLGHATLTPDELTTHWDKYALFVRPPVDREFLAQVRSERLRAVQDRLGFLAQIRSFI